MIDYLVPFPVLSRWWDAQTLPSGELDMPYASFIGMIRRLLEPVGVDRGWYEATYPAVAEAVAQGAVASAYHHFLAHGYFEDRLAFPPGRADRPPPVAFSSIRAMTPVYPVRGGLRVRLSREAMLEIVHRLLAYVPVDEAWYRRRYPGVAEAIEQGGFASAAAHFVAHGYREARQPFDMTVDAAWYPRRYPDAAEMIARGEASSARDHFDRFGYHEGRFPAPEPLYRAVAAQEAA